MIFDRFWSPCTLKFRFGIFDRGATRWVKFENFHPGGNISLWNFASVVRKVSLYDFWPIIRTTAENSNLELLTMVRPDEQNSKIFTLERVFSLGTLHQWCVKFLSMILDSFWLPYSQKLRISTFDHGATIFPSGNFRLVVRPMEVKIKFLCKDLKQSRNSHNTLQMKLMLFRMLYSLRISNFDQAASFVQEGTRGTYLALIVIIKIHFHIAMYIFYFWVSWLFTHSVDNCGAGLSKRI